MASRAAGLCKPIKLSLHTQTGRLIVLLDLGRILLIREANLGGIQTLKTTPTNWLSRSRRSGGRIGQLRWSLDWTKRRQWQRLCGSFVSRCLNPNRNQLAAAAWWGTRRLGFVGFPCTRFAYVLIVRVIAIADLPFSSWQTIPCTRISVRCVLFRKKPNFW